MEEFRFTLSPGQLVTRSKHMRRDKQEALRPLRSLRPLR
jgi:hypothetical protein